MGIPKPGTPEAEAWIAAGKEPEPTAECLVCGGRGWAWSFRSPDGIPTARFSPCTCPAGAPYRELPPQQAYQHYCAALKAATLFREPPWSGRGVCGAALADFSDKTLRKRIDQALKERRGLYVWGPPGTGKTHLAAAILRHEAADGRKVWGLNVARWFGELRQAVAAAQEERAAPTVEDLVTLAAEADVLAIDDLGAQRLTAWNGERLYELADSRWLAAGEKLTVVTSNWDLDQLVAELTPDLGGTHAKRLASRIAGACPEAVKLGGKDWRLG